MRPRNGPIARLGAWLSQERVFRWIPFVLVEGTFILVIIIPFLLTIYISFLRWRANRPFEQAYLSGLQELRGGAVRHRLLGGARAHLLFRRLRRGVRARHRLRAGDAGAPGGARAPDLHHRLPDPDDGCAGGGRLQLFDDLYRPRPAQPAAVAADGAARHGAAHPLAVRPAGRAMGDHPGRCVAVDLAHLPDLPVRLLRAAAAAHQRRPGHGRLALADLLVGRASRCSSR